MTDNTDLEDLSFLEGLISENQRRRPYFTLSAFGDVLATDLDEQLDILQENGLNSLELRTVWGKNVLDLTTDELKKIDKTVQGRGMTISCIASPVGNTLITEPFEVEKKRLEKALEIADWLGSSYVRLFSFIMPAGDAVHECYRSEVMHRLTNFAEESQPWGIILLHENEKGMYGDTAERAADVLQEVGSGNLRGLFSPASFAEVGVKPCSEAYPLLDAQITYVHIKDSLLAPDAEGELEDLLKALWGRSYQGFLSLEPQPGADSLKRALAALNDILARVQVDE